VSEQTDSRVDPSAARVDSPQGTPGQRAFVDAEVVRRLLAADSPRAVLERIHGGDPLALRDRVAERLEARALLLDPDRAWLRSLAYCARYARRLSSDDELEAWLLDRVDEALLDLVREDDERMRIGAAPDAHLLADVAACAVPLGLDARHVFEACASFNRLAPAVRGAFVQLVLRGRGLDELAAASRSSATEVARRARSAMQELLARVPASSAEDTARATPGEERTPIETSEQETSS